jgi:hypothetical protein
MRGADWHTWVPPEGHHVILSAGPRESLVQLPSSDGVLKLNTKQIMKVIEKLNRCINLPATKTSILLMQEPGTSDKGQSCSYELGPIGSMSVSIPGTALRTTILLCCG